jgi:hypothetical protein
VEITDPKLVGELPRQAPVRAAMSAAALAAYVPRQFLRGLFASKTRQQQLRDVPSAVQAVPSALHPPQAKQSEKPEFSNLAVARRYGNE